MSINLYRLFHNTIDALTPVYGASEARWLARVLFHRLKGWDQTYIVMHADDAVSDFLTGQVQSIINRLLQHEPIQQIFGVANFYGMDFKVTPSTLIPRPETAELVDLIIKESGKKTDLRVLDIGTGTGCIAIALARNLPFSKVSAIDINADALSVARDNAKNLRVNVNFIQADALNLTPPKPDSLDIIVSNPPYILPSEQAGMSRNVLDYEPHSALFVPEENPLQFYIPIAVYARLALSSKGNLWFEINPLCANSLRTKLEDLGFVKVEIITDIHGSNRFIHATQP